MRKTSVKNAAVITRFVCFLRLFPHTGGIIGNSIIPPVEGKSLTFYQGEDNSITLKFVRQGKSLAALRGVAQMNLMLLYGSVMALESA